MEEFMSIDEMNEHLDQIAEKIPRDFYKGLTGGIVLVPETKIHPQARWGDLIIKGEYVRQFGSRYIRLFYGSFKRLYQGKSKEYVLQELEDTLIHEFRHHLEGLSGIRDLEIIDEMELEKFKKRRGF